MTPDRHADAEQPEEGVMPIRDDEQAELEAANQELHARRAATKAGEGGDAQAPNYILDDPEALDREAERIEAQNQEYKQREREQQEQRLRERAAASERNAAAMKAQREADTSETQRRVAKARARSAPKDGDTEPAATDRKSTAGKPKSGKGRSRKSAAKAAESEPAKPPERKLLDALLDAEADDDVSAAVAQFRWTKVYGASECPAKRIPTWKELSSWWFDEAPKSVRVECNALLASLIGGDSDRVVWGAWPIDDPSELRPARPVKKRITFSDLDEVVEKYSALPEPRPRFPIEPLVDHWQRNSEADLRAHPILPGTIVTREGGIGARPVVQDDHLQLSLGFMDTTTPSQPQQQHLPGLEPLTIDPAPVLPLVSWDSAGGVSMTQGRGAALGIRLYIETLLSVPSEFRRANGSPVAVRCKLRQLKDALWPRGWQRNRDWPRLMAGINELRRLGVEWESNGTGGIWFAVTVRNVPRNGASLDDLFVFEVMLPPGSGRGPMVDRHHVHLLGLDSAPAFRLYLALCWYWDYYGTHKGRLIGADVPNPHKPKRPVAKAVRVGDHLVNPAALRWYPSLSRDDLATMAYAPADLSSEGTSYRRDQRARAREALTLIAKITGSIVLPTERADGTRNCVVILPSPHYKAAHDAKAQAWTNLNGGTLT